MRELTEVWEDREKRLDLRAGVIAAAVFNAQGGIDGQAVTPGAFFGDQTPAGLGVLTDDELEAKLDAMWG